jgi:hypothetical protein
MISFAGIRMSSMPDGLGPVVEAQSLSESRMTPRQSGAVAIAHQLLERLLVHLGVVDRIPVTSTSRKDASHRGVHHRPPRRGRIGRGDAVEVERHTSLHP